MQISQIRLGTRGSPLALAQARETKERLCAAHGLGAQDVAIVPITTTGDLVRDRPLSEIGGKGLFTKELDEALMAGTIDAAVHSIKDLPAQLPDGIALLAVLPREDARDAFISGRAKSPDELKHGAVIGSASVRRTAQMLRLRPDLRTVLLRGNVGTRLKKLEDGVADATFLACAGLNRLGLGHHITMAMPMELMLPAVAQGAIGITARAGDQAVTRALAAIDHAQSSTAIACERAFLQALDGSCRTPLAGHAMLDGGIISFRGHALTLDGAHCFETARQGAIADAARIGRDAGLEVKALGGALIAF